MEHLNKLGLKMLQGLQELDGRYKEFLSGGVNFTLSAEDCPFCNIVPIDSNDCQTYCIWKVIQKSYCSDKMREYGIKLAKGVTGDQKRAWAEYRLRSIPKIKKVLLNKKLCPNIYKKGEF